MAGRADIRIRTWGQESIQFSLKEENHSLYLQPLDRDCAAIAVRALDERTSLRATSGCCWRKPQWLRVQVMVGDEVQALAIKVSDVADKWGVTESVVRAKCDDQDFEKLVPSKIEPSRSSFSIQPSTATSTMSSVEESDEKEASIDLSFLQTPSFVEFMRFLKESPNKDQYLKVLQTLGSHWPNLQKKMDKELRSWQRKCEVNNLPNLPISCKPFPLEYFPADQSIWLHLTLGNKKRFAINLSAGKFYQLKISSESEAMRYRNHPEFRISEFLLSKRKTYRLLTPYFSTSTES
jgi:hypothetical protein